MSREIPTEIYYAELIPFRKLNNIRDTWNFKLGIESGKNAPFWVTVGINKNESQECHNFVFD